MAKPLDNLNKSDLYKHYNLVNVYDGVTLMKSLPNIKPNHFYAEYTYKNQNSTAPKWFVDYMENFKKEINDRFEKHEQLFREHGWIK